MQYVDTSLPELRSEPELVRHARKGNEQAFLVIYHRHRSAVYQFAWRMSRSTSTAEDVTQECFLALVRGAAFDKDRGTLRTYLFGIALNLLRRRLRTSEREAEEPAEATASTDVLGELLTTERLELVARAEMFKLVANGAIAPTQAAFNLYVLHDPWKPDYAFADTSAFSMGAADRAESLVHK